MSQTLSFASKLILFLSLIGSPVVFASTVQISKKPMVLTAATSKQVCGTPVGGGAVFCIPENVSITQTFNGATAVVSSNIGNCSYLDGHGWQCWGIGSSFDASDFVKFNAAPAGTVYGGPESMCHIDGQYVDCVSSQYWDDSVSARVPTALLPANGRGSRMSQSFGPFKNPRDVSMNDFALCVLDGDTITCSYNSYSRHFAVPKTVTGLTKIVVGRQFVCGKSVRGLQCWDENGELNFGGPHTEFAMAHALVAGDSSVCAVLANSAIECVSPQYLPASYIASIPTALLQPSAHVTDLALGTNHACAALADGSVQCWGDNQNHQTEVPQGLGFVKTLSAGTNHTCAVLADNRVQCWGRESEYDEAPPQTPLATGTTSPKVAFGGAEECDWNDRDVRCTDTSSNSPIAIPDLNAPEFFALPSAASDAGCAIDHASDGHREAKCWGGSADINTPPAGLIPQFIALNSAAACAIGDDNTVWCWGDSQFGGFVGLIKNPVRLQMNDDVACVADDFGMSCWGTDAVSGKLSVPNPLQQPHSVLDFAMGDSHICAITADTSVKCWGGSSYGQLSVPLLSHPTSIIAADNLTCASDDHGVTCWGQTGDLKTDGVSPLLIK